MEKKKLIIVILLLFLYTTCSTNEGDSRVKLGDTTGYKKLNHKSITYYKWIGDGEPPSHYKLMIDWQENYQIRDLYELNGNEIIRVDSNIDMLIANFEVDGQKVNNTIVILNNIYFKGKFSITNCNFSSMLALSNIRVDGHFSMVNNTFYALELSNSIILNTCSIHYYNRATNDYRITSNILNGDFNFSENKSKNAKIINNKFSSSIRINNNDIDYLDIDAIKFINPIDIKIASKNEIKDDDVKTISTSEYFTSLKTYHINWIDLRSDLLNLKNYFIDKKDNYNSNIFEELERKAYFEYQIYGKNILEYIKIAIAHFLKHFLYTFLASTATLATIISAWPNIVALASFIWRLIKKLILYLWSLFQ